MGYVAGGTETAVPPGRTSNPVSIHPPTTRFGVSKGMVIAVIVSIAGTIIGLILLLFGFMSIRGRVNRNTARRRDRENSFGLGKGIKIINDEKADSLSEIGTLPWTSITEKESLSSVELGFESTRSSVYV